MSTPLVHVLVINWNGAEHLPECFGTLMADDYPNARLVLLDNGSTDGSVALVRERFGRDPRVEIVETGGNLGWSGGNNVGIRRALEAGADYVFLINNDTATEPGALGRMVALAESNQRIGAVAPKMLLYDTPDLLNSLGLECTVIGSSWDRGLGRIDGPRWDREEPVLGACGGACLLRCPVLRQVGLLPEEYGIYLDDLELCLRIWNAGQEVWTCPGARVRHKFSATMGTGGRARAKHYLNARNRLRLVMRNFPLHQAGRVLPLLALGECKAVGRALLDREAWKAWHHAKAWGAACAHLPAAWAYRRDMARRGTGVCRFWDMIRKDRLFYPGVPLPDRGWYPEQQRDGLLVRTMARRAVVETAASRLRVVLLNCYPRLGVAEITIRQHDTEITHITVEHRGQADITVTPGTIEVIAGRIFHAEDTGEPVDAGGWLSIEEIT